MKCNVTPWMFVVGTFAHVLSVNAATVLEFEHASYEVSEADSVEIRVAARPQPTEPITFLLERVGGTAGPEDFYWPSQTSEMRDLFFTVARADDGLHESDETVTWRITSPTGGAVIGARNEATLTIHNAAPLFRFFPTAVSEDGPVVFHGSRSGDADTAMTVEYATGTQGTAVAGVDFTPVAGQVRFEPGQTSTKFEIPLIDNGLLDAWGSAKTLAVLFSHPSAGEIAADSHLVIARFIDNEIPQGIEHGYHPRIYRSAPGTSDPQFDDFRTGGAVLQPDGKLLVSYGWGASPTRLVRFNADGTTDGGFGTDLGNALSFCDARGELYLRRDGAILVFGQACDQDPDPDFVLPIKHVRLDTNGVVQQVFISPERSSVLWEFPLASQSDGKMLFAWRQGQSQMLVRFNPDFTMDSSFRSNTIASQSTPSAMLQSDGKIVVVYVPSDSASHDFVVSRLHSDGSVDSAFAAVRYSGTATSPFVAGYAELNVFGTASDKIVLSGSRVDRLDGPFEPVILRLNADGSPDPSFRVDTRLGGVSLVGLIPDGRLHVSESSRLTSRMAAGRLFRLLPDGSIDPDFVPARFFGSGALVFGFLEKYFSAPDGSVIRMGSRLALNGSMDSVLKANGKSLGGTEFIGWTSSFRSEREGFWRLSITLCRTGDTTGATSVRVTPRDGTAIGGRDYVFRPPEGALVAFRPLQSQAEIEVSLMTNKAVDGDREFQLILSQPGAGYAVAESTATIRILDDEFGILPGSIRPLANGGVGLSVLNPPCGAPIQLQVSTDLEQWTTLSTHRTCERSLLLEDPTPFVFPSRFYRVSAGMEMFRSE